MMRLIVAGFVGFVFALPASAQFYGGAANSAPATTQGFARGLSGAADQGANIRNFSVSNNSSFLGGGGSSNVATPWSTKYGGYVQPANSGMLQDSIARQQAYFQGSMQNQDLALRKLQLKQATFDEMMYEKMNTPPDSVIREQMRQEQLSRARSRPPINEISSGQALNSLLKNVQMIQAREGVRGYSIPVDPDTIKHLNVTTTENNSGSNEMFKNQEPEWPLALLSDKFASLRQRFNDDVALLVKAQRMGQVDQLRAEDARKATALMKGMLFDMRFETSFNNYAKALEGISKLENTVELLAKPGGKNFLDGTYAAQGNSVGELIDYMTQKGLTFAPATPGFEPIYVGFYQQMVTYDISISRLIGDQSTMMYQPTPPKK